MGAVDYVDLVALRLDSFRERLRESEQPFAILALEENYRDTHMQGVVAT